MIVYVYIYIDVFFLKMCIYIYIFPICTCVYVQFLAICNPPTTGIFRHVIDWTLVHQAFTRIALRRDVPPAAGVLVFGRAGGGHSPKF